MRLAASCSSLSSGGSPASLATGGEAEATPSAAEAGGAAEPQAPYAKQWRKERELPAPSDAWAWRAGV
eukprot:15053720-Alexandrium_andersonii.AAC.1